MLWFSQFSPSLSFWAFSLTLPIFRDLCFSQKYYSSVNCHFYLMSQIKFPSPGSSSPSCNCTTDPMNLLMQQWTWVTWGRSVLQQYHHGALAGAFLENFPQQKGSWELSSVQLCEPAHPSPSIAMPHQDLCFLSLSCLFLRSWIRQYHYTDSYRWLNSVGLIRKMLSVQQEISARNLQMPTAMNQNLATFCPVFSGRQLPTLLKGRLSTGEFGSHISQVKKSQCQTLKAKPAPPKPHLYIKVLHTQHWVSLGFPSKVCFESWK